MLIIGCDYHPSFQQIAFVDAETGDYGERRLQHREEAEKFYRDLVAQGKKVRVGMEASGQARWFERVLAELNLELWIGDAGEIQTKRVRKQKTDREDARLLLRLLMEDRFPRIWVPSWENRDLRQLLWHRHRPKSCSRLVICPRLRPDRSAIRWKALSLRSGLGARAANTKHESSLRQSLFITAPRSHDALPPFFQEFTVKRTHARVADGDEHLTIRSLA